MNGMKLVYALLAALLVVCGAHAYADPLGQPPASARPSEPAALADARCVIVGISMGNVRGVTPQTAGMMIALYYLGRLDGRSPAPDLEALIGDQAEKITPAELKAEAVRCGPEIGQRLVERGRKQEGR